MSSTPAARSRKPWWPLGKRSTASLVAACVAVGVAVGVGGALVLRPSADSGGPATAVISAPAGALRADAVWPAGRRPAPPFALRDQAGRLVALSGQRGRAVLLAFMDSHCKLICTLEGPTIALARRRLAAGAPVTVLIVTVNPWQDTAASTRAMAAKWRLGGDWHWLRGSQAQLAPIWRAYGITVERTAGDVSHSTAIYLIDRRGYERAGYNWPFTSAQVRHSLLALVASRAS